MTIQHDETAQRLSLELALGEAFVDYEVVDGRWVLHYSFVSPELRGQGIARELVSETFEWIMADQQPSRVTCSYIQAVAESRPEWAEYFLGK